MPLTRSEKRLKGTRQRFAARKMSQRNDVFFLLLANFYELHRQHYYFFSTCASRLLYPVCCPWNASPKNKKKMTQENRVERGGKRRSERISTRKLDGAREIDRCFPDDRKLMWKSEAIFLASLSANKPHQPPSESLKL